MARRQRFGNVSKLPSGNYRARYRDPRVKAPEVGPWINAPHTFDTKAAAEAWLADVKHAIDHGTWRHPDELKAEQEAREREEARTARLESWTVQTWAEAWLEDRRSDGTTAAGTLRVYASRIRRHIAPTLGRIRLTDLTSAQVTAWHRGLPSRGVRTQCYRTLRAMLNAAVLSPDTALTENPCQVRGGDSTRGQVLERYLFSAGEVAALADAMDPRARALVLLLADAGLRINEALALRREDLTLGEATAFVEVRHSIVREGRGRALGPTKTKEERRVQITPGTATALRQHLETYTGPAAAAPVFSVDGGSSPLSDRTAATWLRDAMGRAGVVVPAGKQGGWHAFRHYSATRYGQAGASLAAIMRRYGWRKPEQAMHYQRADADYERDMLDRMATLTDEGAATWAGLAEERRAASAGVVSLDERRRA